MVQKSPEQSLHILLTFCYLQFLALSILDTRLPVKLANSLNSGLTGHGSGRKFGKTLAPNPPIRCKPSPGRCGRCSSLPPGRLPQFPPLVAAINSRQSRSTITIGRKNHNQQRGTIKINNQQRGAVKETECSNWVPTTTDTSEPDHKVWWASSKHHLLLIRFPIQVEIKIEDISSTKFAFVNKDLCRNHWKADKFFCLWHSKSCGDKTSNGANAAENSKKWNWTDHNCSFPLQCIPMLHSPMGFYWQMSSGPLSEDQ